MSHSLDRIGQMEHAKENFNKSASSFNPDKRIASSFNAERNVQRGERPEQDRKWDVRTEKNEKAFDPDKRIERKEAHYTTYEERLSHTPSSANGEWTGKRGESKYIPADAGVKNELKEYKMDGIEYKNGIPDFSPVAKETVKINKMTDNRASNFQQADVKCAEAWNAKNFEDKSDWTGRDVKNWRHENECSWHERSDMKKCDLLSSSIHQAFPHTGGVAECKRRDGANEFMKGGGFDA